MKVEQKEKGFNPVVITLESQEEVNLIAGLLGATTETIAGRYGCNNCFEMYDVLSNFSTNSGPSKVSIA